MNNKKLNAIDLKLDECLKGGIPAGQFFCLLPKTNNDDIKTLSILKNRDRSGVAFVSLKFNPADCSLEKRVIDNSEVYKNIVYSAPEHIEETKPINELESKLGKTTAKILMENEELIDNAIRDAVKYKLGYFNIEILKDKGTLVIKDGLEYLCVENENLLIIDRGNNLLNRPRITKLYEELK